MTCWSEQLTLLDGGVKPIFLQPQETCLAHLLNANIQGGILIYGIGVQLKCKMMESSSERMLKSSLKGGLNQCIGQRLNPCRCVFVRKKFRGYHRGGEREGSPMGAEKVLNLVVVA